MEDTGVNRKYVQGIIMKILSWNYRGLGNSGTVNVFRSKC